MKEFDVWKLITKTLAAKKSLAICLSAGFIVGVVVALNTPKDYTSEVLLAPEMSSGGLGLNESLTDMASSFGINLDGGGKTMDALYPEIYPEILSSDDFAATLFAIPVRLKDDDSTRTYFDHLAKDTKVPFWDYPKIWLIEKLAPKEPATSPNSSKVDPFRMSKVNTDMCKAIEGNISCLVDKKTSVILISVTDQDPMVAAIVADTVQNRLQSYITTYRTKKARNDFNYYKKLYLDAKQEYLKTQHTYATYCDANQDVLLEAYKAKRDELENNMQLAFNLMSQMSAQMQTAKAKIQEHTPAYTMIKSPKMTYKASSMSRAMIVFIFLLFACAVHILWVIVIKENTGKRTEKQNTGSN